MVTVTLRMAAPERSAVGNGCGCTSASPVELRTHSRKHLGAEELDGAEERGVRHAADVHLEDLPAVAEQVVEVDDALGDLLGPAGEHHAAALEVAGAGRRRRAAAGTADLGHALAHHAKLEVEVVSLRTAGLIPDEAVHRDSDVGLLDGMAHLLPRRTVAVAVLRPALRRATEDPEEQRDAQFDCPHDRRGAAP